MTKLLQSVSVVGQSKRPVFGPSCPNCGRTDYPHICIVTVEPRSGT